MKQTDKSIKEIEQKLKQEVIAYKINDRGYMSSDNFAFNEKYFTNILKK